MINAKFWPVATLKDPKGKGVREKCIVNTKVLTTFFLKTLRGKHTSVYCFHYFYTLHTPCKYFFINILYLTECLLQTALTGWKQHAGLGAEPRSASSPDSWEWRSTECPWLTAWSQPRPHTQEGQGRARGAGEERPLCYQGSASAEPRTPVTPGHPNAASFCTHARGCTNNLQKPQAQHAHRFAHRTVCTI